MGVAGESPPRARFVHSSSQASKHQGKGGAGWQGHRKGITEAHPAIGSTYAQTVARLTNSQGHPLAKRRGPNYPYRKPAQEYL